MTTITFSSDPTDTVREYAPGAVRAAAYHLAVNPDGRNSSVRWSVRDDNRFDVVVTSGRNKGQYIIDREGNIAATA